MAVWFSIAALLLPVLYRSNAGLAIVAVLPVIVLLVYVYRKDMLEREPKKYLLLLVLLGAVSGFLAMVLSSVLYSNIRIPIKANSMAALLLENFVLIAAMEEACKLLFLRLGTWKSKHFNCRFDGIVYAVCVSLGFALLENILYVMRYGMQTGLMRMVTAVPGHMCFAVFMGIQYGLAKERAVFKDQSGARMAMLMAWLNATLTHGLYDTLASLQAFWPFLLVVGIMFWYVFYTLQKHAENDYYIIQ